MNTLSHYYSTESEIEFIRALGTWSSRHRTETKTRQQLLEGYLHGARARHAWGRVDGLAVIEFAERALSKELEQLIANMEAL